MKRYFFFILSIILCNSLFSIRNWTMHTNSTYMRNMRVHNGQLVISTWGGVELFDLQQHYYVRKITMMEGLKGNDVSQIFSINEHELMIAINDRGIDRLENWKPGIALTTDLGLPSLVFNDIYHFGITILVALNNGLSVFEYNEESPFPLFIRNYNNNNGLPFTKVFCIRKDEQKYYYFGSDIGISKVHQDSIHVVSAYHHQNINQAVYSIDFTDGLFVLGTSSGIYTFSPNEYSNSNTWLNLLENESFSEVKINSQQGDDEIFAVLGYWDDRKTDFYNPSTDSTSIVVINNSMVINRLKYGEKGIFKCPATSIYFSNGTIYITTWGAGLYSSSVTVASNNLTLIDAWNHYQPNSIHSNFIRDLAVDQAGKVWFCTGIEATESPKSFTHGVSSYDTKTNRWEHLTVENSGILSNNITTIGVDADNKKWFGSWWTDPWDKGLSILNDQDQYKYLWEKRGEEYMGSWGTITYINRVGDEMWVCSNDRGVTVFDKDISTTDYLARFTPPIKTSENVSRVRITHKIDDYAFFTERNAEIMTVWRGTGYPITYSPNWEEIHFSDVQIIGIASHIDPDFTQTWFVSAKIILYMEKRNGLSFYYQIDTSIKKQIYTQGSWRVVDYYTTDEERLFGGEAGAASCVTIDPFGRVWIGSSNHGITIYDIYKGNFMNLTSSNSPLPSNEILKMAYDPTSGLLFICTTEGVVSVEIGRKEKTAVKLYDLGVYPNPFQPAKDGIVTIRNKNNQSLPIGKNECRIFDLSGQLITVLKENRFLEFEWDGKNQEGKKCSSGVYFYLIKTEVGETATGKIVMIR